MEEAFNKTLTSLLFAPGAQNWYGYELNVPDIPFPKKEKIKFPLYPNKKPILPSGEIANLAPPPEVSIQGNGTNQDEDVEDDYQISDEDDEMECENTTVHNRTIIQPVIRLDSCGREVEDFREIMQPSSDEDETVEPQFAIREQSSSQSQPLVQEIEDSSEEDTVQRNVTVHSRSLVTNNSQTVEARINQQKRRLRNVSPITNKQPNPNGGMIRRQNWQLKNASPITRKQPTSDGGMIHRQYWPVNNADNESEPQTRKKHQIPAKFVTTDIKIDQFNGMLKYTFIKKPIIEPPEVSSDDDDETTHQNGSVRNDLFSQNVRCEASSSENDDNEHFEVGSEHSDSSYEREEGQINEPINSSMNPWISSKEMSSDSASSSDEEDRFPDQESMVIKEKENIFVIYIKMEDFKPEDVAVYIQGDLLLVEGTKVGNSPNSFLRSSRFNWEFNIPDEIDIDSVNSFDILPGQLKIVCPKIATTATME